MLNPYRIAVLKNTLEFTNLSLVDFICIIEECYRDYSTSRQRFSFGSYYICFGGMGRYSYARIFTDPKIEANGCIYSSAYTYTLIDIYLADLFPLPSNPDYKIM